MTDADEKAEDQSRQEAQGQESAGRIQKRKSAVGFWPKSEVEEAGYRDSDERIRPKKKAEETWAEVSIVLVAEYEPCKHDAGVVTTGGFDPICLLCHRLLGS